MHASPRNTLEECATRTTPRKPLLAKKAALSRSVFFDRFTGAVGVPPRDGSSPQMTSLP